MAVAHLEFLVEDASTEAFIRVLLPRLLPSHLTFDVHPFQGKSDLLEKVLSRLRGYERWLPESWRIVVVVDRDDDDCQQLKQRLDDIAAGAGLITRSQSSSGVWQVVNRLAIEELEAWYFGNWSAVCNAYPKLSSSIPAQAAYRNPDAIRGGTWESLERIMKKHGYFKTGLRKIEVARAIGNHVNPSGSNSHSFARFYEVISEAMA